LHSIAKAAAITGSIREALLIAQGIPNLTDKAEALAQIAKTLDKVGVMT
jgi:hypothetical protein